MAISKGVGSVKHCLLSFGGALVTTWKINCDVRSGEASLRSLDFLGCWGSVGGGILFAIRVRIGSSRFGVVGSMGLSFLHPGADGFPRLGVGRAG